jgi:enoyl-CoA hydratase
LTIAAVNGPAVGAGLNLALVCDVRVVAQSARFDCRFLQLALHPGGGHTWMLQRLLGPQGAAAMLLAGEALDGEAAVRRGLAWSCVDDSQLLDEARRLAAASADAPPAVVEMIKGSLRSVANVSTHAEAVEREIGPQLRSIGSADFKRRLATLKRLIKAKK